MSALSVFIDIPTVPLNPETKLLAAFNNDTHPDKVYLAQREHLGDDGQVSVLPVTQKIKQQIVTDPTFSAEYSSCLGLAEFTRRATELALGKDSLAIVENRVLGIQTVGCTGAVRLGAEILRRWYNRSVPWTGPVYVSSPCHDSLVDTFKAAGISDVRAYRYWDGEQRAVSMEQVMEDLAEAPEQAVVVLSASAHCPTGADLSQNDWTVLAAIMVKRRLLPFFLMPAQGLCLGHPEQDAWPVRHCASLGLELLCAQSFSHSFGLYGDRVGHLLFVLKQNSALLAVQSQAENVARSLWARPTPLGARVVTTVLGNPAHLAEWRDGVRNMAERCMLIREQLKEKLRLLGTPGRWDHLTQQGGLYCCTGLTAEQVGHLAKSRHVYLLPGGCLNVTAINWRNIDYVAESIYVVLTSAP